MQVTSLRQKGINFNSTQAFDVHVFYEFEMMKNVKMLQMPYIIWNGTWKANLSVCKKCENHTFKSSLNFLKTK